MSDVIIERNKNNATKNDVLHIGHCKAIEARL